MPKFVKIKDLVRDPRLQSRAKGLDDHHVTDIVASIEKKEGIDPIKVCVDPNGKYCYDGWHRVAAYERKGYSDIPCETESGSIEDAIEKAASANQTHGLKRTNDDKRRAVELLLALKAWGDKSDRAIADQAGVGHQLVADVRAAQLDESSSSTEPQTRVGKDGKKRKVKAKPKQPKAPKDEPPGTDPADGSATSESSPPAEPAKKEEPKEDEAHAAVNGFLRSLSARVKTAESTVAAMSEELSLWNHKGGSKKLPTASALSQSLRTAATSLKAVAAAVRDAVIEQGPCVECNGKGGACKGCGGDGYQSVEERRNSHNRRAANAPRGASA